MASRSLNKVTLIGNLTRDPELRFTPQGTAVCSFGLATNRSWTTESGEKKEETEFHRIVSWNKLAELCSQLLQKGRKVYVEGRLQTRNWTGTDQVQHSTTEIVIEDMILLDSRRPVEGAGTPEGTTAPTAAVSMPANDSPAAAQPTQDNKNKKQAAPVENAVDKGAAPTEDINPDDIPF